MVRLTQTGRTTLSHAVRHYLESLPNINELDKNEYRGEDIGALVNFISRTFCSSARNPRGRSYEINLPDSLHSDGGTDANFQTIDDLRLDSRHRSMVRRTLERKRGISVALLIFYHPDGGHACLLVFDARTKRQHFFNPWGFEHHWLNIAFAEREALVEGFRPARADVDGWPNPDVSMQLILDQNDQQQDGNCAVYCVVVAILCTRFGIGKPRLMADVIVEAIKEIDHINGYSVQHNNPAHAHMTRMWYWMNQLSEAASQLVESEVLRIYSPVTEDAVQRRTARRQEASAILQNFPALHGPPSNRLVINRNMLRERTQIYLNEHPEMQAGQPANSVDIAEDKRWRRKHELYLLKLMFPSSITCHALVRTGNLCSRKACLGQPLCWQHRYYTRNHVLTGYGRMRCAARQQPCHPGEHV